MLFFLAGLNGSLTKYSMWRRPYHQAHYAKNIIPWMFPISKDNSSFYCGEY